MTREQRKKLLTRRRVARYRAKRRAERIAMLERKLLEDMSA